MTQRGWIWLCTNVDTGMTITNCWELFLYGVKRDHYENFIGIREFLEQITVDCFSNTFITDIGNPENNIPSFDSIDNEGTVYTCKRFNYSSSSTRNSKISTI